LPIRSAARCKTFAPSTGNADKSKKFQKKSKATKALELMLKATHKSCDNEIDDDDKSLSETSNSLNKASESESIEKQQTTAVSMNASKVSSAFVSPRKPSLFLNIRPSLRARLTIPKLDFTKLDLNSSKFTDKKSFVAEIGQEAIRPTTEVNRLELIVASLLSNIDRACNHDHHILLIESSVVCLKFITRFLQHAGYKVTSTSDPQAAFDFLDSSHLSFSIIIMDIFMSDTHGNLLAKYVTSLHLKSIFILTSSSNELEVEAKRLGAMAFLKKPCQVKELIDICRQVLDPNFTPDLQVIKKGKEKRNVVINLIFLESSYVLVGICSDSLLRFWDLGTARVLCACVVDDFEEYKANQANRLSKDAVVGRHVQSIVASYNEATIAAAYDDGIIRVFEVLISSIDALRAALYDQMERNGEGDLVQSAMNETMKNRYVSVTSVSKGMAVSPLKLISEWRAHEATILSLNYISVADTPAVSSFRPPLSETYPDRFTVGEDPASHEKDEYIVSSGMDQMVYLWDIHGKLIGVFGHDDWEVENSKSYKESERSFHTKQKQPVGLQPAPPDCMKPSGYQSHQKVGRTLEEKISWREYRDKVRGIGSNELNKYVVSLRKKPPVGILDEQCNEYQLLADKHPILKVETMEAAFKAEIPVYDRSGIERKRRAKVVKGVGRAAGKMLRAVHREYRPSSS
jgi:CheY-like chemotaxis protein